MNIKAWIQSSNEKTDDFVLENGKLLPIEDKVKGREFMNIMFNIKEKGRIITKKPFLEIVQSKKEKNLFLVDMSAENKDVYDRRVAVMLLIDGYEGAEKSDFVKLINETFESTVPQTEISEETKEEIMLTIEKAKKSVFSNPFVVVAGIVVGVGLLFLIKKLCEN
jgi:hypothetical protein